MSPDHAPAIPPVLPALPALVGADAASAPAAAAADHPALVFKVVVAGGFGVGKTTLVGAVSEIEPLSTEEHLTVASTDEDPLAGVEAKSTTTVSLDFGRITFSRPQPMALFVFGTPGQERFWFFWDELCQGAVGAVVLVDTRRLPDSFAAVGYFEQRRLPFVIAVNYFDGAHRYTCGEIRDALGLPAQVPVIDCDARNRRSACTVLITLVQHVLSRPDAHSSIFLGTP
jgi:signal recognition particle receptor subunit beta